MLRLVAAGPALAAIPALRRLGTLVSAASALAFLDIATRTVVPGANDNLTAVAVLLELARLLREQPVEGVRVLLVSTGSEESFMEGMRGWVRRHGPSLDPARTRVVVLETLGSPELILLEGEGMIWMTDYDPEVRDFLARAAERAGRAAAARPAPRLRHRRAVGAARRAAARPRSPPATTYKMPANYHSQRDVPHNVDFETVGGAATRVAEAAIRTSSERREAERVLAGVDLARVLRLLELGQQAPEPRPADAQLARDSSSPRTSGSRRALGAARQRAGRASRAPARGGRRSPARRSCRAWRAGRRR